jgi:hypothetical protein
MSLLTVCPGILVRDRLFRAQRTDASRCIGRSVALVCRPEDSQGRDGRHRSYVTAAIATAITAD